MNAPTLAVRRWRGEPVRFLRFGVRNPTAKETWKLFAVDDMDDEACAAAGLSVVGPVLDASRLSRADRIVLSSRPGSDEAKEILALLPRRTAHGYDVDLSPDVKGTPRGGEVAELLADLVRRAESPARLRESFSAGDPNRGRHLERGPVEEGAETPDLSRTLLRQRAARLEALGLVRWTKTSWTLPEWAAEAQRAGKGHAPPGVVDLVCLNRGPDTREALFRPLGGAYKEGRGRKTLCPWSSAEGDPITADELADAPPAPPEPERKVRRWAGHAPLPDLPAVAALPRVTEWARRHWRPTMGHELRLALAGTLIHSGLVTDSQGIEALALGTGNRIDARDAWVSTRARIARGRRVTGSGDLRERLGVAALADLAWALLRDLQDRGTRIDHDEATRRVGVLRPLDEDDLLAARRVVDDRLGQSPEGRDREALEQAQVALLGHGRCGRRARQKEACACCGLLSCPKALTCSFGPACPRCARRAAREAEDLELPERVAIGICPAPTRRRAEAIVKDAWRTARDSGTRAPIGFVGPRVDGTWMAVTIAPAGDHSARASTLDSRGSLVAGAKLLEDVPAAVGRAWASRVRLARHVVARELLERGDAGAFLDLATDLYRRRSVRESRAEEALRWPGAEELRALRRKRAQERKRGSEEAFCEGCPVELAPPVDFRFRLLDVETGRVIAAGLSKAPSFAQAVDLEDGRAVPGLVRPRYSRRC